MYTSKARPTCPSCQAKPVALNRDNGNFFKTCFDCKCKTKGCFDRAVHDSGLCDFHFKRPVADAPAPTKTCRLCMKPCLNIYCNTCFKTVPNCSAINCKKKVIMNDGVFFEFCQFCKCSSRSCTEPRPDESEYCEKCEANSVCQSCSGPKSTNHDGPNCRKCQIPKCATEKCVKRTGYYKDDNGDEKTFLHCKSCICDTKFCNNPKVNGWYCAGCVKNLTKVCQAEHCGKPIEKQQEYCLACNSAYQKGLVKCPTPGCGNYKFDRVNITMCAPCYNA